MRKIILHKTDQGRQRNNPLFPGQWCGGATTIGYASQPVPGGQSATGCGARRVTRRTRRSPGGTGYAAASGRPPSVPSPARRAGRTARPAGARGESMDGGTTTARRISGRGGHVRGQLHGRSGGRSGGQLRGRSRGRSAGRGEIRAEHGTRG